MFKLNSVLLIFTITLITSACNESGSGSATIRVSTGPTRITTAPTRITTLSPAPQGLFRIDEEFFRSPGDHGGVARFRERDRSASYHILTTNMDDPIVDPSQTVNTDALDEMGSRYFSEYYSGKLTRRRITGFEDATFHMYIDKDWPRVYALLAVDSGGYTDFEVGGPDVSRLIGGTRPDLPGGTHTYTGTTIITPRHGGNYIYEDKFEMTVQFDQSRGNISANVVDLGDPNTNDDDFRSLLTGEFGVDYRNSTFHGDSLRLEGSDPLNNLPDFRYDASIYGSFHNHRGTGVTGVYFDNSAQPMYGGAIVGARTRY